MPTITTVPGTDTVNKMREAHNDNDAALKTETEAATAAIAAHKAAGNTDHDGRYSTIAALTAHKTSTDHDGRYYTETEIDAAVVKKTGDQDVGGVKSFTDDLVVKKAAPGIELKDAAGNKLFKLLGSSESDNAGLLQVFDTSANQYVTILKVQKNGTISDAGGNPLATRRYAQGLARSGFFFVPLQRYIASVAGSTTYQFVDPNGRLAMISIPNGAILKRSQLIVKMGSIIADNPYDTTTAAFTDGGYTWLTAQLVTGSDLRSMLVQIYGCSQSGGVITSTKIVEFQTNYETFTGALDIVLALEFSL
jgi:hypothetical protein